MNLRQKRKLAKRILHEFEVYSTALHCIDWFHMNIDDLFNGALYIQKRIHDKYECSLYGKVLSESFSSMGYKDKYSPSYNNPLMKVRLHELRHAISDLNNIIKQYEKARLNKEVS